jgi:Putative adhesin
MTRQNGMSNLRIAALTIAALSLIAAPAYAWAGSDQQGSEREEFHKVYPLSAQGHVEIANVNGPVHIAAWDRPEVKVDAVKSAWSQKRLDEAKIEVEASPDRISIRTEYPGHDHTFNFGGEGEHNNPARVEYTVTVPRQANLDEINLVNGRLDIQGVAGDVHASCVNGQLEARNLQGRSELSTVNGYLYVSVDQLPSSGLKLSSVNGSLHVTLPSDTNAEVKASTMSGSISNDFGLPVTRHQYVGHSLHGQLGAGGAFVKLSNVNGAIDIRHASDGRPLSPAQNLEQDRRHDKSDDEEDDD